MKYIKQLDGLRFVAVFLVLVQHFAHFIGREISAGYYGVDLFFVISGFLITMILLQSRENFGGAYKKFLGRRTLRIFPVYYLTILILFLINFPGVREHLVYLLTYTYNYAIVELPIPQNSLTHFWSLCVEEQFYLVWPLLVLMLRKKLILLIVFTWLIIIFCVVQYYFDVVGALSPHRYTGLVPRAYSLCLGAMGSIFFLNFKFPVKILESKWAEVIALLSLAILMVTKASFSFLLFPVLSLFFILKTFHGGFKLKMIESFLLKRWVVYLGTISYGIYVYHLPLAFLLTEYFFNPFIWNKIPFESLGPFSILQWHTWLIKFPLYSLLTIAIAHFSYTLFEKPTLRLKEKYFRYNKQL